MNMNDPLLFIASAGERLKQIGSGHFLGLLAQILLALLAILLIFYLHLLRCIRQTAEWVKKIARGEALPVLNRKEERILRPLTKEILRMARRLVIAKSAAEEEARLRHRSESIWTAERLKEFVRTKLDGKPLIVVSNREPYRHIRKGKNIETIVPPSGLVTAIEPVLKACGGTWIAQGNGDADRETVDENDRVRVPPEEPQYTLRRVWLEPGEVEGYYYGFANEGLWPLCHIAHTRPVFREEDWYNYNSVNEKFARVVLQELDGVSEPCILIQDYHFALLPNLIKAKRPDARLALFWHIPWPNPESFGICPWQKELLRGMLGADIIGFHTQYHCNNFLETVDRFLESRIDYENFSVARGGQTTWVKPFPISIAFSGGLDSNLGREGAGQTKEDLLKPYGLSAQWIGVGVDRLDYTKGILERFKGVEAFLDKNQEYQGKFTFVELAAPSRTLIPKYQQFGAEVEKEAERINARFKGKNWKPIILSKREHSHKEILPFYKHADVCLVTSLHDGMNLVAKEFVAARDDEKGVLILSQFTGAARDLDEALIVNPYDIAQVSDMIKKALEMHSDEQIKRMRLMRQVLKERNIYRWAADLVGDLAQLRLTNDRKAEVLAVDSL